MVWLRTKAPPPNLKRRQKTTGSEPIITVSSFHPVLNHSVLKGQSIMFHIWRCRKYQSFLTYCILFYYFTITIYIYKLLFFCEFKVQNMYIGERDRQTDWPTDRPTDRHRKKQTNTGQGEREGETYTKDILTQSIDEYQWRTHLVLDAFCSKTNCWMAAYVLDAARGICEYIITFPLKIQ